MKSFVLIGAILLIAGVLLSGCTSQPAAPPATPVPVVSATPEETHMETTFLIGTTWQLGWYDDTKGMWSKVIDGSTITAVFSDEGKISGFSGCSEYTTDYQLTDSPGIWIRRPAVPETVCQTPTGVMTQQSQYYTDLEWAKTYAMKDEQLLIFDESGKKILQFDKIS